MPVLSRIARILPEPKFITLPSVGVDISDTSIKYVQFARNRKKTPELDLKQWGDIDLPDGALKRGLVEDQEKFVGAMKEVAAASGATYVRVSLPEERAYIFETEIQRGTALKEIRGLLEFRLEENVPLSPREAYFDYDIIEDAHRKNVLRVIVTAYGRDVINSYYEACRAAKLIPLSFEVEAQAIARATIPRASKGTHMIVDFGKTRSGVGIVNQGNLMYTSTIDIGGVEMSKTLRRALGELSESELTRIKNTQGIVRGAESTEVFDALISLVSVVRDEIHTRIEYWHTKERDRQDREIESIILCGGSANLKGLPEYLTESLGIETHRADVWQNAFSIENHIPPIGRRYSYGYATAIGLALNGLTPTYD